MRLLAGRGGQRASWCMMGISPVLTKLVISATWAFSTPSWAWALCITMLAIALGAFRPRYGAALKPSAVPSVRVPLVGLLCPGYIVGLLTNAM